MSYNGNILSKSISISKIYSIHYFEYMSDFSFEGESTTSGNSSALTREKFS